jgi:hypothetical protein
MTDVGLFDVVELLVNLPEYGLQVGMQGAIVECNDNKDYAVEFSDEEGVMIAACALSRDQFIVVSQAQTKS